MFPRGECFPTEEKSLRPELTIDTVPPMSATIVSSVSHRRRLARARAWLESRGQSEELLLVGATLDGANELARAVAKDKGVAFGWHRLSISQLAYAMASPGLAA